MARLLTVAGIKFEPQPGLRESAAAFIEAWPATPPKPGTGNGSMRRAPPAVLARELSKAVLRRWVIRNCAIGPVPDRDVKKAAVDYLAKESGLSQAALRGKSDHELAHFILAAEAAQSAQRRIPHTRSFKRAPSSIQGPGSRSPSPRSLSPSPRNDSPRRDSPRTEAPLVNRPASPPPPSRTSQMGTQASTERVKPRKVLRGVRRAASVTHGETTLPALRRSLRHPSRPPPRPSLLPPKSRLSDEQLRSNLDSAVAALPEFFRRGKLYSLLPPPLAPPGAAMRRSPNTFPPTAERLPHGSAEVLRSAGWQGLGTAGASRTLLQGMVPLESRDLRGSMGRLRHAQPQLAQPGLQRCHGETSWLLNGFKVGDVLGTRERRGRRLHSAERARTNIGLARGYG